MSHSRLHLFQGYGVELEYMIVDQETLKVRPISDEVLKAELGHFGSDVENGMVTWSNELVLHVLELKSTSPESDFLKLNMALHENILKINSILDQWNAKLMPSATHPFMNPYADTKLWPHDGHEIYAAYDLLFDCKGHGWSNLQSTHLNLPFYDDEEFAKLHAAIRLVLPILPALCASSPIMEGKITGLADTRLDYYKSNQKNIPSIVGKVIPEALFSKRKYTSFIYEKIKTDLEGYPLKVKLNPVWVNSRGAIARFDRGSIEIRLMDCQESPLVDLSILFLVTETIKALVSGKFIEFENQKKCKTQFLSDILNRVIQEGDKAVVNEEEFLRAFGIRDKNCTALEMWERIFYTLEISEEFSPFSAVLKFIFKAGNLSSRIIHAYKREISPENMESIYHELCVSLKENKIFNP